MKPKNILSQNLLFNKTEYENISKLVYFGEVVSVDDNTEGGRIKVRIKELDINISDEDLPWAYPLRPKFFHAYPQKDELVRVILTDVRYPNKARLWEGSIISQLHKIGHDDRISALSTTHSPIKSPDDAPSNDPDADGVFPDINDIGLIGRENTDVLLKINQVLIRAGKHVHGNPIKLNTKNPAQLILTFEEGGESSNSILMGDKIALITHNGNPKFKSNRLEKEDRKKMFENGHPIARGDILVDVLNLVRRVIVNHIHGYNALPPTKDALVLELENLDFEKILQKDIVIN